ncbi:MAG: radical family heme chaperone HemW [Bacteroidota bacterium]|jgi:oxygen-independent coproporphyrinogen-3 oxidase
MGGLYVHIPFCRKRCTYCDFHFSTTFENYRSALIGALCLELKNRASESTGPLQTLYFGGGTPSLLRAPEWQQLFDQLHQSYLLEATSEITIEANPEDLNLENLMLWRSLGINRLSIGIQSFENENLKWMNRAHAATDAVLGVKRAQECGFSNISVDLIYGLPGQQLSHWKQELETLRKLQVQHLSAYCLTVEPKTALNYLVRRKKLQAADELIQTAHYQYLLEWAEANGFEHYEISNFSTPGHQSKHNRSYWQFKPYIGIGPSAHSFDGKSRRWNVRNNTHYIRSVGKTNDWFERELLTKNERWNEQLLVGLRTKWGVMLSDLEGPFTAAEQATIEAYSKQDLLVKTPTQLFLTERGKWQADGIAAALFRVD